MPPCRPIDADIVIHMLVTVSRDVVRPTGWHKYRVLLIILIVGFRLLLVATNVLLFKAR